MATQLRDRGIVNLTMAGIDQFVDLTMASFPITYTLDPTSGTMTAYFTTDPAGLDNSAHRSWETGSIGTVTTLTSDVWPGRLAGIKFVGTGNARVMV